LRVKIHKFKTIDKNRKGSQIQGWHLDLAGMPLNWFLKSKSQLMTWLNKAKIKDWFGNRHVWILAPFFLMKRHVLYKTTSFHSLFIKKKELKTMPFWRHCTSSSSPGCAAGRGKRFFFSPYNVSLSLSPTCSKNTDTTHTHGLPLDKKKRTSPAGGCLVATQLPYPFGAIR
jgi:hypothetical protein